MKLVREFFEWNGNLYEVLRTIKESNKPNVDVWKEHLRADTVLRRNDVLFFCRKVEDAQIIEDEKDEKTDTKSETDS